MLTGYTDLQAVFDAINQGAVYKFILKPWDSDLLLATVNEAFLHKRMADANLKRTSQLVQINRQLSQENQQLRLRIAELEQKLAKVE
jgi:FixJ family two-component response regulator